MSAVDDAGTTSVDEPSINHPLMWVKLEPTEFGIRAVCIACGGSRTFGELANGEIFLDVVAEAMTDHVLRNHA